MNLPHWGTDLVYILTPLLDFVNSVPALLISVTSESEAMFIT